MTLRGSVASFPLETIVQLLAATAKTGQLEIRSGGESGTLGFAEGRLVSAVSGDDAGDPALGAVFTLADGDFEFVPWGEPPDANLAGDLNQILDRAVVQRDKIVADRTLISDDRVRFALSDRAAAGGEVRLSAEQWRALLAVNGERDLRAIAVQLGLGRLATLAMLADLVRAGIVDVKEAPPEQPPPAPGSGSSGGSGGSGVSLADTPPARAWDGSRAQATEPEPIAAARPAPAAEPAPAARTEPEEALGRGLDRLLSERQQPAEPPTAPAPTAEAARAAASAWEEPPPLPPRETRVWEEPVVPREIPDREVFAAPPLPSAWDEPPAPYEAAAPPKAAAAPVEPIAPPSTWDTPVEQPRTWQAPAPPTETERDWGLPAQDWERSAASTPAWNEPSRAESARPDAVLNDSLADRIAALEGQDVAAPTPPPASDPVVMDERLSALSGLFDAPAAPAAWPAAGQPPSSFATPAPVAGPEPKAPPAVEPKKKGGLFSGLFKKEEAQARVERPTMVGLIAQTGTRVAKLAAFANALLDEFNNGQYGKGRLDDRIANLLMRVDEQADPIDRPLPIVDDRIDVATLERANMSERQVAPYLALLVSQIYEDAEHAFGKDKAKRGFKSVQAAVVGDAAALGTDLRLPRV